jgi:hypothetical protein
LFGAPLLRAAEPPVIAKARAFLGAEEALNGLKSLRFQGTLVTKDPANPAKETKVRMEIIFQHPFQQRMVVTSETTIETTALDGYDGWGRVQDAKDPSRARQTIVSKDRLRRLRANTWENLAFYRAIEKAGGRVEEQGTAVIDGITCQKLAFTYGPNIIFYRFMDPATGRLVHTETESGDTIREQGEMVVNGIRFPRTLITTSKDAAGRVQTAVITFEQIEVNQPYPASLFAVPSFTSK